MVEQQGLNTVFAALSDPTRRDILERVGKKSLSIGEIAQHYTMSFAAVAKHVDMLTRYDLVTKTRHGKEQIVTLNPAPLGTASHYLEQYRNMWEQRLDALGRYLKDQKKG
jgi:DNA-binding transcriptional ArsR family regulator